MSAGGGVGYREGRSGLIVVVVVVDDRLVVLTELLILDDFVDVDREIRVVDRDGRSGSWIFNLSSLMTFLVSTSVDGVP